MATNRIDILDPALLRPGRIDRKIEFPPPGPEARVSILRIHSRKMSLQRGINLRSLAEKMGNCSGAEVRGICTEAGMYALRERRQHVTQEDFELAVAKVRFYFFSSLFPLLASPRCPCLPSIPPFHPSFRSGSHSRLALSRCSRSASPLDASRRNTRLTSLLSTGSSQDRRGFYVEYEVLSPSSLQATSTHCSPIFTRGESLRERRSFSLFERSRQLR
jgi:hypothetical protein